MRVGLLASEVRKPREIYRRRLQNERRRSGRQQGQARWVGFARPVSCGR